MKQKKVWSQFEDRIKDEAPLSGVTCWKIPTEVRVFRNPASSGYGQARVKSHPDFTAGICGLAAFFDAKSTHELRWNLKKRVFSPEKCHQWQRLDDAWINGNVAGYLIWFVEHKSIVWASVGCIKSLQAKGEVTVTPLSPGVIAIPDNRPINLKDFMKFDLERRMDLIKESIDHGSS